MGAVSALSGIKSCMTILHGSQGCATYIRRHMATHYNEPVDIASSSLTEEGTVFGGEANLLKGLKNLIDLYNPEVIGVCTTCLAETIGEDVAAVVKKFFEQNPGTAVEIINVASPGYGGTQNEGWFAALRAAVEQVKPDKTPNNRVNIIMPQISPADTRWLKNFLAEMGIDYILLPDISDNLDGVTEKPYNRLKKGGTPLSDVAKMAGARLTIEFSEYTNADNSPAEYLRTEYGVPFVKLPLPAGVRAMDTLIETLERSGGAVTENIMKERGRYLDAMVDSHKYCNEARAAVFGEPDFVTSVVRLCCENGILPVVIAAASVSDKLKEALAAETEECREFCFSRELSIVDDSDFAEIERLCVKMNANLLIGSSDARRISRRLNIPLIRCAFPIHDHVGGQRARVLGFEGSLSLLDQTANAMIDKTETSFRSNLYQRFFKGSPFYSEETAAAKTTTHPCFGEHACHNARVHLPVAPECNIQCNYCLRSFDCMNESRPGVSSKILTPIEAFERYKTLKRTMPNVTVAGIAGPGDALANFGETRETLRLIREYDPNVTFCIATNGLMLPQYAGELKALGVSHVTVTVNAVDPEIGAKIYRHIHFLGETYTGIEGASILIANQLAGIKMLADGGVVCKVNCVTLKGINDSHLYDVTRKAAELGAFIANIMPHIPVKGSAFEGLDRMTNKGIEALRTRCAVHIKQMAHCRQCRSDAAGTLAADISLDFREISPPPAVKTETRRFAAASKTGAIVDMHFGHAQEFYVYESDGAQVRFIEKRGVSKYCNSSDCGGKEDRWESVINALRDCSAVLALRTGMEPERKLKENGIDVITTYEKVETAVLMAAKERSEVYGVT
jgi:nitrogenase molybdenum-iron protein alpha/beta subunit/MoaA/NifB/PqqE/SkfB family radical SAM enzyme